MEATFLEPLGWIIIAAAFLGFLFHLIRLPLLLGYIVLGLIFGLGAREPSPEFLKTFSTLGISFLLFSTGLHLHLSELRRFGKTVLLIGGGQILFTGAAGYLILQAFGVGPLAALTIALAITFSSTIIIVKLLSDLDQLETLQGRIILGFLIIQDIVALFALAALSGLPAASEVGYPAEVARGLSLGSIFTDKIVPHLSRGILLICGLWFAAALFRPLLAKAAKSEELLFMSALAWLFGVSFATRALGFSIEAGAFLAGVSLATLPWSDTVADRIKPLRDFFLVIFFFTLGASLLAKGVPSLPLALTLAIFIIIGNPLIVFLILTLLRFRRRVAFLASLPTAQVSEFSFLLLGLAREKGIVSDDHVALVTLLGLVTIPLSFYLFLAANRLERLLDPLLRLFERPGAEAAGAQERRLSRGHIVLLGCHRAGRVILESLKRLKAPIVVVDNNPEVIEAVRGRRIRAFYGDAHDPDIVACVNAKEASLIISTIPDHEGLLAFSGRVRRVNPHIPLIALGKTKQEALALLRSGATLVILPQMLAGHFIATILDRIRKEPAADLATALARLRRKNLLEILKSD